MFDERRAVAQASYRRFVHDGIGVELNREIRGERLGSAPFLARDFGHAGASAEIPRDQLRPVRLPLEALFGAEPMPIAAAYRVHGYRLREIAEFLDLHPSTVSYRLRRGEMLRRKP